MISNWLFECALKILMKTQPPLVRLVYNGELLIGKEFQTTSNSFTSSVSSLLPFCSTDSRYTHWIRSNSLYSKPVSKIKIKNSLYSLIFSCDQPLNLLSCMFLIHKKNDIGRWEQHSLDNNQWCIIIQHSLVQIKHIILQMVHRFVAIRAMISDYLF